MLIVYTGSGKGKTTAALGLALRAWGWGLRVIVLQFLKHSKANFGEHRAAKKIGLEVLPWGDGFTWLSKDIKRTKAMAQEQWERSKEVIRSGLYDVVILDEFTYPLHYGWIPLEEVLQALRERPEAQHVIITGRYAPQALIEAADLVTEMREIKHPFKKGIRAQRGVDY